MFCGCWNYYDPSTLTVTAQASHRSSPVPPVDAALLPERLAADDAFQRKLRDASAKEAAEAEAAALGA